MAYAVGTFGVTIERFFCCGQEVTKAQLYNPEKPCCKKNGTKKGCCKEEKVSKKLSADQAPTADQKFKFESPVFVLPGILKYEISEAIVSKQKSTGWHYAANPPPLIFPSLNILYCIFRI